jgi:hydroxyethylthiazole kinase
MKNNILPLFDAVRQQKPLVHQITNAVTINDCANVTLAIGASPVMTSSPDEVAEMVQIAQALVINTGTINEESARSMIIAAQTAHEKGIPVILDPVGAGATTYRSKKILTLLETGNIDIIRGNASEIDYLYNGKTTTRGVDAGKVNMQISELAMSAAKQYNATVVISGKQDVVSNGHSVFLIDNGDSLLTNVTGTGCMATALIGAFAGVTDDMMAASIAGISVMGVCGELAARKLAIDEGTATFRIYLIDAISLITEDTWKSEVKIHEPSYSNQ